MEEINGDKIKIILNDLDEEFYRFNPSSGEIHYPTVLGTILGFTFNSTNFTFRNITPTYYHANNN